MLKHVYKNLLHKYRFKYNEDYRDEYVKRKEYHAYLRTLGRDQRRALKKICAIIRAYEKTPAASSRTVYRLPE